MSQLGHESRGSCGCRSEVLVGGKLKAPGVKKTLRRLKAGQLVVDFVRGSGWQLDRKLTWNPTRPPPQNDTRNCGF